jgi:hypothetical protein
MYSRNDETGGKVRRYENVYTNLVEKSVWRNPFGTSGNRLRIILKLILKNKQ